MRSVFLIFLILTVFVKTCLAQTDEEFESKAFVIIASTQSIERARVIAQQAAQRTGLRFRDSRLHQSKLTNEPTFPADTCQAGGFEYPCYVPRGRYDDGAYISIEHSSEYQGFTPELFLVMAGSGNVRGKRIAFAMQRVKPFYATSYIKTSRVYMGCIH